LKRYEGYALITGGSSGLGLEFAHQLAAQGYDLVLVARDETNLEKAADSIREKHTVQIVTFTQDLRLADSGSLLYEFLKLQKISVGLLVNNAGYNVPGTFHEADEQKMLGMVDLMCLGYTDLIYKFLPDMLDKKQGAVILIASLAALVPMPKSSVYAAAKAFTLQLGISLHAEYTQQGIDVLVVCPSLVDTNIFKASGRQAPDARLLTPQRVIQKTLDALGKKIVIVIPHDLKAKILFWLSYIMPRKILEKVVLKEIKKVFKE
jgi:short-subunit dehydrogenase